MRSTSLLLACELKLPLDMYLHEGVNFWTLFTNIIFSRLSIFEQKGDVGQIVILWENVCH